MDGHSKLRLVRGGSKLARHSILVPVAARIFGELDVGASLYYLDSWLDIHEQPLVARFEIEHGGELERWEYNDRSLEAVRRSGASLVGRHRGTHDLFVPIRSEDGVEAVLVVGPFETASPTSSAIVERWRELTGRPGELSDPEFSSFVETTLSRLVIVGAMLPRMQRLVECIADLMAGSGTARQTYVEVEALRDQVLAARIAERMWKAATAMIDERTSRLWAASCSQGHLVDLGITQFPKHALVALAVGRDASADPIADAVKADAFRRACVTLALDAKNVVPGLVGQSGVVFLAAGRRSPASSRSELGDFAQRLTAFARKRFGLSLHVGMSVPEGTLSAKYQSALTAAEAALARGVALVHAEPGRRPEPLGPVRASLARCAEENPRALTPLYDRYLEVVAARYARRWDGAQAQLEAGFDRIGETLVDNGALEAKSLAALRARVDRACAAASTMKELVAAYRDALRSMVTAADKAPAPSRHVRGLGRAEAYMREHHAKALTRAKVASVAGFAETYFSELFHRTQGVTFERHLRQLRLEHAKKLLMDTPLQLQRIAELSGFGTRQYLTRVFKSETGETPFAYRKRALGGHAPYGYVP